MAYPSNALFFFEEDQAIPEGSKPLMLMDLLGCPVLKWTVQACLANGVQRFFAVCSPRFAKEARDCFPEGTEVLVSEQQSDLMAFLDTGESVLVLPRAGVPMKEAGAGFAYAASGYDLSASWQTKMTNAVQGAELISGWLPVLYESTLDELETVFRQRGIEPPEN